MRKLTSTVLIAMIAASIVGCGGGGGDSSASSVGGGTTPPPATPPAPGLGSATISWTAPDQNTDGSALAVSNIAGFEIRYGQNVSALDSFQTVNGVGASTYVIENLTKGTWYFSVATRNANGILSNPSTPVSKVIS